MVLDYSFDKIGEDTFNANDISTCSNHETPPRRVERSWRREINARGIRSQLGEWGVESASSRRYYARQYMLVFPGTFPWG